MKITDKRVQTITIFEKIKNGDAFEANGNIYIKMDYEAAFCLTDGITIDEFARNASVEAIELEVIVRAKT